MILKNHLPYSRFVLAGHKFDRCEPQGIQTKQNKRSAHTHARAHAHTQAHPFDNKET